MLSPLGSIESGGCGFLLYCVKFLRGLYSNVRFVGSLNEVNSQNSYVFKCSDNPSTSWRYSCEEKNEIWLPVNGKSVCGLLCTLTGSNITSLPLKLICSDQSNHIQAKSTLTLDFASTLVDQGTFCVDVGDEHCKDTLYLYYITIHGYQPPAIDESQQPLVTRLPRELLENSRETREVGRTGEGGPSFPPLLIGHAGAGVKRAVLPAPTGLGNGNRAWPENTVAAFRRAEQLGLHGVECDAGVTRDGHVVLHHNFTVRLKPNEGGKPELEHLPDKAVDETTQNLLGHYSLDELCALVGRQRSACSTSNSNDDNNVGTVAACPPHPRALGRLESSPDADGPDGQPLPTLSDALRRTSPDLMFDVELKYPSESLFGLICRSLDRGEAVTPELPGPHTYFHRMNNFCDAILDTIWNHAGPRKLILTSFNADICITLSLKQTHFPVLFITRGGIQSDTSGQNWSHIDQRHTSLRAAIAWAKVAGLAGIVTLGQHFGSDPEGHQQPTDEAMSLSNCLADEGLHCLVYGPGVSTGTFREASKKSRLAGLIIDNIDYYMHEYKAAHW